VLYQLSYLGVRRREGTLLADTTPFRARRYKWHE
jgi:hypothetical protein